MVSKLVINFTGKNVKLNCNNISIYNKKDKYDFSNYHCSIVIVSSLNYLKDNSEYISIISNMKLSYLIILNHEPYSFEKSNLKNSFQGIITGLNEPQLKNRLKEIIKLV
tara:strand:+ start:165 stop:491 length:327 start_codon:yes stop_codon:yes gene_type:complete